MSWFHTSVLKPEWLVGLVCALGSIWRPKTWKLHTWEVIHRAPVKGLVNLQRLLQVTDGRSGRSNSHFPYPSGLSLLNITSSLKVSSSKGFASQRIMVRQVLSLPLSFPSLVYFAWIILFLVTFMLSFETFLSWRWRPRRVAYLEIGFYQSNNWTWKHGCFFANIGKNLVHFLPNFWTLLK